MKTVRIAMLSAIVIAILAVFAVPAFAQQATTNTTVIITEDEINSSFRVTNNRNRNVTDINIDLQPSQAVVSFNVTYRGGSPIPVNVTLTPNVLNSRMNWTASAAAVNGSSLTTEQINSLNQAISASWRSLLREYGQPGRVTSVGVDDSNLTIEYARR